LEALLELRPRAALVTSSSRDDLQVLLVGSGLAPFLETVVTGNDVQAQKPDPAGYLLALERLALPADQCLAIEDSPSGVRAAFSAGLRVVAVSESGSPPQGAFTSRGTAALAIRFAVSALSS
jgi:HAD superfamily hydrolase (TIGR01509 family)